MLDKVILTHNEKAAVDLDELMRLHDAATPGPWKSHPMGTNSSFHCRISKYYAETEMVKNTAFIMHANCLSSYADAEYICAACNAVPELVSRIRELEAKIKSRDAQKLAELCNECAVGTLCPYIGPCPFGDKKCGDVGAEDWLKWMEEEKR